MTQAIQVTNRDVLRSITAARTKFNAATSLRLFKTNVTPAPADVLATYTVANYTGYANIDISGLWGAPVLDQAGQYSLTLPAQTFIAPTSGASQDIYGWYIVDDADVILVRKFPALITMSVGGPALTLNIKFQDWASLQLLSTGG